MKWANFDEIDERQKLLYWALMFVLAPYFEDQLDHWLKHILVAGGGIGGDPGWEIEHVPDENNEGSYRVWCDSEISGIYPDCRLYSASEMMHAVKISLLSLCKEYDQKTDEVFEIITKYNL